MLSMEITASHGSDLIRTAMEANRRVAGRLAGGDTSRVAEDMVELIENKHSVGIGVALIKTADEMQGTLIDLLA